MQQKSSKKLQISDNFSNFSERLAKVLSQSPQAVIAKRLNVSQNTISAWLRGDIPKQFGVLFGLAKEFDVDLNWLITGKSSPIDASLKEKCQLAINRLAPYIWAEIRRVQAEQEVLRKELKELESLRLKEDYTVIPRLEEIRDKMQNNQLYIKVTYNNLNDVCKLANITKDNEVTENENSMPKL